MTTRPPVASVLDTSHSPFARLRPVPLAAVQVAAGFWAERRDVNRTVTIPEQYQHLEETGRLDNLRRAGGAAHLEFRGIFFNDSDVYKWLEAACWTLVSDPDSALERQLDGVIALIVAAQQPDGYLNSYFMFDRAAERFSNFDKHEMYCAGHLFQAAVAHYRATGKRSLLDVATRFADYLDRHFGSEEQGKRLYADGHQEVELALVELYRVTGERRYLDLAGFFVDVRGYGRLRHPDVSFNSTYYQDQLPFRELEALDGHAVRAVYYACAAADLYAETGEAALQTTLERLWHSTMARRMYVTGALGARYEGEAFGKDYELPNARAYAETCAGIASVMWNQRMLMLDGDARYADMLELALYNAVLPGVSLDGQTYFYQNPLADDGRHRRQPWFGCACCPPNIARLVASLPGYLYSLADGALWLHSYADSRLEVALPDGQLLRLRQRTDYPWDGEVELELEAAASFTLQLRIPGWCEEPAELWINGRPWQGALAAGEYVAVERDWSAGDRVRLRLPMPVRRLAAHPAVTENLGRVALMRGPLVYCVEGVDHPGLDVRELLLPADADLRPERDAAVLGGAALLRGRALRVPLPPAEPLYSTAATALTAAGDDVQLTAVPYFAWANREPGRMEVWLRTRP